MGFELPTFYNWKNVRLSPEAWDMMEYVAHLILPINLRLVIRR